MFSWRTRFNLDPYFRAVYVMQFIAVGAVVAGLFLTWWGGGASPSLTALNLLDRSLAVLRAQSLRGIAQPLVVLWLLVPSIAISGLRSFTGLLVTPVTYRRLALAAVGVSVLALAHFLINYGGELAPDSPLKDGRIQAGFWLTGSSTVLLGLLILAEGAIKPPDRTWAAQGPIPAGPVDDAGRLWRGEYLTCPHCGMLNEPGARACFNCHNVLFDLRGDRPPS